MRTLDLKPKHLQQVQKLLEVHVPWAEVWAYGSRVDHTNHEASDLDLVLRDPRDLTRPCRKLSELREAFTNSNLPILVDLLDWARIPAVFRQEIEANHITVQRAKSESDTRTKT